MAFFGPDNLKGNTAAGNGLGPRTVIVKISKTDITQGELDTMADALSSGGTYSGVTNDAFTITGIVSDGTDGAFVGGTSDVVFVALQGTGTINADSSDALGVTGAALTVEASFNQM